MANSHTHEDLRREEEVKAGSNRSFGFVFAAVFAIIGLLPLISGGGVRLWSLAIALVFLAVAFVAPKLLAPLNIAWFWFGMLLGKVVSPIVMAVVFYGTVAPIGALLRWRGKDPLRLRRGDANSYWIERDPPGPPPDSLKNQF
jgi:hypothetical protein